MSEFLMHGNKNCSSTFHNMMFLFHTYKDFFLMTNTFQRLDCEAGLKIGSSKVANGELKLTRATKN